MNPTFVFAKTDLGDDAVAQRTRLVQRNLRTVLILVDGRSTVEELVDKVGSAELVNQALDQLERDGFISRVGSAARNEAMPDETPGGADGDRGKIEPQFPPQVKVEVSFEAAPKTAFPEVAEEAEQPPRRAAAVPAASPFGTPAPANPQASPFSPMGEISVPPPFQNSAAPGASPFSAPSATPFGATSAFGTAPAPAPKPTVEEAAPTARVESSDTAPRPQRRSGKILTPKRIVGGLAGLLALLVAVALVFPYDSYRTRIEAAIGATLGQPVRISSVRASFFPAPALVLSGVAFGEGAQVSIAEIRAVPSVFSLFSGRKAFGRISLIDAQVPMELLGALASGLGAAGGGEAFSIGSVDFTRINVGLRDLALSGYSGRAEIAQDGALKRMELFSPDQTLKIAVNADPGSAGAQLSVEGQKWKAGENSAFVFDSLSLAGVLSGTRLQVHKVEGRMFDGVLQGQLILDWADGMAISGDVSADYMSATALASALGSGKIALEGQANARIRFRAAGANWQALAGRVPLEGDFILKSGAINGMDLVEAVRRGGKLPMRGGTTRFEQATGKFRWDGQALQLNELDLASGLVRATGSVGVLKSEQVSGVLTVVLRGSAATVATPVSIVGSLKDPQLLAGRR